MDYYYDDEIFYTKAAANWLVWAYHAKLVDLSLFQTAQSCVVLQNVRDDVDYAEKLKFVCAALCSLNQMMGIEVLEILSCFCFFSLFYFTLLNIFRWMLIKKIYFFTRSRAYHLQPLWCALLGLDPACGSKIRKNNSAAAQLRRWRQPRDESRKLEIKN